MSLLGSIWKHPANQNRRIAALARAVHWQISKRLTGKPADIDFHGLALRCFPNSHSASRAIYFRDYPDFNEMRFMRDYLRPGDKFIDVGANVGLYTLLARALVGQSGHVDSFEPMKATFKQLREEIDLNKLENVAIHNLAVSDVTGFVSFNETTDDCTAHVSPDPSADQSRLSVRAVRLDSHLPDDTYAMMKMDIEGYEPFALRGTSEWLRKGIGTWRPRTCSRSATNTGSLSWIVWAGGRADGGVRFRLRPSSCCHACTAPSRTDHLRPAACRHADGAGARDLSLRTARQGQPGHRARARFQMQREDGGRQCHQAAEPLGRQRHAAHRSRT